MIFCDIAYRPMLRHITADQSLSLFTTILLALYRPTLVKYNFWGLAFANFRPSTCFQIDIYQMSYSYNWLSWWWAHDCSKHEERFEINMKEKRIVPQVGYLQRL